MWLPDSQSYLDQIAHTRSPGHHIRDFFFAVKWYA
jgi:hypothetical protein